MKYCLRTWLVFGLFLVLPLGRADQGGTNAASDSWALAMKNQAVHRFSTLFTAQDVRGRLSSPDGLASAVEWCRASGVTKVYIEEFRDGYQADRSTIENAKEQFLKGGFKVSGCVTPTQVGKASTGWKETISCYTDPATQDRIQAIFEYAAGLFDEIMIDDFWFTDCTCPQCEAARQARLVTVGSQTYPVAGDSWEDYRGELMDRVSRDRLLKPAKRVNPRVHLIIKFPQWYENFHERGYDVLRETADFDRIWVGTESRDYADPHWGGKTQYESFFIMRWLGGIGGEKCGGGWFDWLGTTPATYVEQARQTILGGARESMLFCYGGLQGSTGPRDVAALRANLPELWQVANEVARRDPVGIAAYKPGNSHPDSEKWVFDFVGMLGLPLVPCHEFPARAPAAFFSVHALKDSGFLAKASDFIAEGKPVLLTDGLARRVEGQLDLSRPNVQVLKVNGEPKRLLEMNTADLNGLRRPLLQPLHQSLQAPNRVAFYLFQDGSWVLENFNDVPAAVTYNGARFTIPARGWNYHWN